VKKVGIILNSMPFGGLEISVLKLVRGLQKLNKYKIIIIAVCGGELEEEFAKTGVEIRYGNWKEQYGDLSLVINNASGGGYTYSKAMNVPCIEVIHSQYCLDLPKDIAYLITVNDNLKQRLLNSNNSLADRIQTISLSVDLEYFKPETILDDVFTVGLCGRMASVKRPAEIIEPFSRVFNGKNAKLLFVGEGEECANIEKTSKRFNINYEITSYVKDVRPLLYRMDLYCTISSYESFSISTLEAMAMGKCIMATDTDGIKTLLDNDSALIIPKDVVGLKDRLTEGLRNIYTRTDRDIMGQNARKRAEMFSTDVMIAKYEEIIDRVIK
jgi:glycosyltransferase involved in cell wall biosynthesis